MRSNPNNTTVRAWARLMRAQRMALQSVERALKEAALPPLAWYDVLLEVEGAGAQGLRPFELERQMLLAQYNLSRLLDRLDSAGYIERRACADDGRGQVLAITASGKDLRRQMWAVYGPAIQKAVGALLSPAQVETLDSILGVLIERSAR